MLNQSMPPIRIGLLGLGKMGQNHLRILAMLRAVDLIFVFDTHQQRMETLAHQYQTRCGTDLHALLPLVDAVVIATPTSTHAYYIELCSQYVNQLFVEKPLTDSIKSIQSIAYLAKKNQLTIQVGFIERFSPAIVELNNILQNSGQVINIDFFRTNKLSSRISDVDVISDLMVHDIDLALLLNGPVAEIRANGLIEPCGKVGFASATFIHKNGAFSRVLASRLTEKKNRLIQATCIDRFIDCDLLRKEIVINRQSQVFQNEHQPYTISATVESVAVPPQEALLKELKTFIANCQGSYVPFPGVEQALTAAIICEQIHSTIISTTITKS
ncbi:Gfo/Idh/MocA family oxidoreductase [Endozoicomonas sp. SM1973]|uniref:Gfo/Idh/MocA family oxidoreductase n=1 Tax=Spartinivicinus marinus TaxID=2994442 RepID=A0A853I6M4_9GAMM|nr:Gfo/Idh/MocA family oxidoreductase [Spartinivicinus marinus]NYZ64865.1 Gfo/Idh/MocA family oxidoreductase [Spartinivicinus marinus]